MTEHESIQEHEVTHATFTLERSYPAAPAQVIAAWADPAVKARWFAASSLSHDLDFRVGFEPVASEVLILPGASLTNASTL